MSKSDVTWTIIWFAAWTIMALLSHYKSNTPLYDTLEVSKHEPASWSSDYTLLGPVKTTVYVKSYGENHVIFDQLNNLVASGEPLNFEDGESKQPFGSSFVIEEGKEYTRKGYVNIYTVEQVELTFRVTRFGYPILLGISITILIISIVVFISSLIKTH